MKDIFVALFVSCSLFTSAQNVGINTNTPATTLQVVGAPTVVTTADGITFPKLTGDQLKAKDNAYTATENGTVVYATSAVSVASAKTINVIAAGLYYFNGSVWAPLSLSTTTGDIKSGIQSADHNGWIKLDGRAKSTLSTTQQAAATALGIGTNLPNASNAALLQNGNALGSVNGSMTLTIAQNQLPNATLSGTTASNGDHNHGMRYVPQGTGGYPNSNVYAFKRINSGFIDEADIATTDRTNNAAYDNTGIVQTGGAHTHTFTTSSLNGNVTQQTLDITPKSLSVNMFIYLGQ
jgi:hypothetical protein